MALIKCPECGKKISDQAPACIHCGYPITPTHEQDKLPKTTTDLENLMHNELPKDTQGINECVEGDTITVKNKLKLWHKILIIGATIILLVFAAIALFGGLFNNNESDDSSKDPLTNVSTSTNDEKGSDDDFVTPVIQYEFLDYTEFSTYWFDGVFRCGTDFNAGDYYILPLFGAGAIYEVADTPDDFSWTYYRLLRKIHVTDGEYVNVAHGAIMVPADEIDVNNWTKYGVFLVGKDISAGEYKMETLTDKYQSNLYGITGISGAYQLNESNIEETPIDSNYLFDSQKYITLENGQYIIITNIKLTNVNATSSDTSTSNDQEGSDNTDTTDSSHPNNDPIESFISNGHFTFSARSFIKLFDDADKEAKGYNYTYMRMNGETSLFYELAEISGGYEKVRSAGMISFVKGGDTTLSIEDDYTENIITKINVLVEDVDDVPPILVGCMCAVDPALDFTTAYNLGMDVVETAGTEEGYVHNGIKYVVIADGEYYYIIISIAGFTNNKEDATNNPSGNASSTESPSYEKPTHTTATLTATTTDLNLDGTSELVYFYVNPSNIDAIVDYTIADESVVEIQRGGWGGNTAQLLFIPVSTGETTVTVYIDGYDGCSVKISVSAYVDDGVSSGFDFDDPFITSTESEFRLENGNGITYITAHNITGEYSLSCDVDGSDIVECIWGDWDGDTVSLTFIPLGSGNAFVTVYIEGYYDNSAITIPVFVP